MKNILRKMKLRINRIGNEKRNSLVKNKDVTLISNNCWAGITYEYLNLKFNSPTIGLYFMADEYIEFLKNFDDCVNGEIRFISYTESKYKDYLINEKLQNMVIGILSNDIEVFFLHYPNENVARDKWVRRCKRINKNNMIIKFNDQNAFTEKNLEEFENLKYKNKIIFTAHNYNTPSDIWLKKYDKYQYVLDDNYSYHKYINIIDYINKIN